VWGKPGAVVLNPGGGPSGGLSPAGDALGRGGGAFFFFSGGPRAPGNPALFRKIGGFFRIPEMAKFLAPPLVPPAPEGLGGVPLPRPGEAGFFFRCLHPQKCRGVWKRSVPPGPPKRWPLLPPKTGCKPKQKKLAGPRFPRLGPAPVEPGHPAGHFFFFSNPPTDGPPPPPPLRPLVGPFRLLRGFAAAPPRGAGTKKKNMPDPCGGARKAQKRGNPHGVRKPRAPGWALSTRPVFFF